jgi:hypothetical protein
MSAAIKRGGERYKGSADTRRHMAQDNEGVKAFLTELGLARQ